MIKKGLILGIVLAASSFVATAQNASSDNEKPMPFFNKDGTIAIQTRQMNALADTIATTYHRADDIVWSRIVYRVIDLRERQNNQLYFPILPNEKYKNLFRIILDETVSGRVKGYGKKDNNIQPVYSAPLTLDKIAEGVYVDNEYDPTNNRIMRYPALKKDPITNGFEIDEQAIGKYTESQRKFIIQEIVFFNRHYSRMYSKIIGIAPVLITNELNVQKLQGLAPGEKLETCCNNIWLFLINSVNVWYLFDELRPALAKQYIIPNGNETERLTYDEFFTQRLYSSYILGDGNMFDRMLLQQYADAPSIRREQKRIESELLNFEIDLWEY